MKQFNLVMKQLVVILFLLEAAPGVVQAQLPLGPHSPYDSVQQIILDGKIDDGTILIDKSITDPTPEIREQLKYTLGQLNWRDSAPQLSWFRIHPGKKEDLDDDSGLVLWHYRAEGHISWSRDQDMPAKMNLILPARGDEEGLDAFKDRYFKPCNNDPEADRDTFFFYFFPDLDSCPLHHPSGSELKKERGTVVRFPMRLRVSSTNTSNKYPEYGKIWEDGELSVTAIFGKYQSGDTTENDAGIWAYDRFYSMLINAYGWPASINQSFYGVPGVAHPLLKMVFNRPQGRLEVQMALINAMTEIDQDFIDWYQERSKVSDLMIYDGHSGYGDNVQALANLGDFEPGRYQIYFVNGCDTFTYLNQQLFAAHKEANPDASASKYLDIITNSVSSYFQSMPAASFDLIQGLLEQRETYHQILKQIDPRQRAVVDGEQDNVWPKPFDSR